MGGLGLNLTAAECVFLLDPWRNPAEEAQAVDRAHHIGQRRQVFAYRLIARDTVEETVLQLQNAKRDLVAAIISENNSLIRNLQREDLESLRRLAGRTSPPSPRPLPPPRAREARSGSEPARPCAARRG